MPKSHSCKTNGRRPSYTLHSVNDLPMENQMKNLELNSSSNQESKISNPQSQNQKPHQVSFNSLEYTSDLTIHEPDHSDDSSDHKQHHIQTSNDQLFVFSSKSVSSSSLGIPNPLKLSDYTTLEDPVSLEDQNCSTPTSLKFISGRKASRSLRIFRDLQCCPNPFPILKDMHPLPQHFESDLCTLKLNSQVSLPEQDLLSSLNHMSILEPVLLATYFPHTPIETIDSLETLIVLPNSNADTNFGSKHMAADVEFDRLSNGKIKITNTDHLHECQDQTNSFKQDSRLQFPRSSDGCNPSTPPSPRFPLSVELRPFANKVGGHTAIFSFSKRAVCKALVNRENVFYETVEVQHPELLEFMPKYIGVLNVRYSSLFAESDGENQESIVELPDLSNETGIETIYPSSQNETRQDMTNPEPCLHPSISNTSVANFSTGRNSRYRSIYLPEVVLDDNTHIIPSSLRHCFLTMPDTSTEAPRRSLDARNVGSTQVNTHFQEEIMREVFRPWQNMPAGAGEPEMTENQSPGIVSQLCKHTRFEQYILLEDLTTNMSLPCVLDLKMGTRQYGIDASAKKQSSQRQKCASSTSRLLGVRVCGLQIFHTNRQIPINKDKYFGRRVNAGAQFCRILALYLYDGISTLLVLCKINPLVLQLRHLHQVCSVLTGFRLYGLSVLLMYDAASRDMATEVKVKTIDFARLVVPGHSDRGSIPPAHTYAADEGYLRGVQTLLTYFEAIFFILSGRELTNVGNVQEFLTSNASNYSSGNYWLDKFAAQQYGEQSDNGDIEHEKDPFERHYNYQFSDAHVLE